MRDREREVVYVERGGDVSAKWFLWGALAGAAVALFYAPATGEQTRRSVQRKLQQLPEHAGRIDGAGTFHGSQYVIEGLDDIAPIGGLGAPTPEPSAWLLFGFGTLCVVVWNLQHRKNRRLTACG